MSRRPPGRATRQILSGSELAPPRRVAREGASVTSGPSLAFWFLVALAALLLFSTIVWAIWGMGAASPFLLLLALALIVSWIVI
ncbi:MAG: hypothetical protein IT338_06905 [Thermomicrobiales bacterium]|nr:hypothetical protein [Thermomicrobiales bacterium]